MPQPTREDARRLLQREAGAFRAGDYAAAREFGVQCVEMCRALGEPWAEAQAVHLLGRVEHEQNNLDQAEALYDEAQRISRASNYADGIAQADHEKARIAKARGDFLGAEAGFRQALLFYASRNDAARNDPANLEAALNQLSDLGFAALRSPDSFIPALRDRAPVGTPDGYLWVQAHAILAEVGVKGDFYRRRLIQRAMALRDTDRALSDYALHQSRRLALASDDRFAAVAADTVLKHTPVALGAPSHEHPAPAGSARLSQGPLPFQSVDTAAQNIGELCRFLQDANEGAWIYRGQTREYAGPLLPSAFRGIISGDGEHVDSHSELYRDSLRRCGASYYGEYNQRFKARIEEPFDKLPAESRQEVLQSYARVLNSADSWYSHPSLSEGKVPQWTETLRRVLGPEQLAHWDQYGALWLPLIDSYHRRCLRHSLFRLFGYFLGTTLAQQYGLWSEGLDATGSPAIAAFFATHGAASDFLSLEPAGTGVIYRFPLTPTDIRTRPINDYGYYTLPSIINVEDVLYRFEKPGLDLDQAVACFESYCGAVHLDGLSDPDLFFVPDGALDSSRVRHQQAFIILPDELRRDAPGRKPGQGGVVFPEFRYIEDIAARPGVQRFYFKHGGRLPAAATVTREDLWPRDDQLLAMVVALMTAIFPLGMFVPDMLPLRLELIDAGYGQAEFQDLCRQLAARHRMVIYDVQAYEAANVGTIPLRI